MRTMIFLILPAAAWAQDVRLTMPDQPRHVRKMTEELIALSKAKTHDAKVDLFLKFGEERARELEEMQARGKSSHNDALAASYNDCVGKGATGAIENGAAKGRDMTIACGRYVEATSKHTAVLERVLANAPEAARKGLLTALAASQHGHQQAMLAHQRGKGKAGKGVDQPGKPPGRDEGPGAGKASGGPGKGGPPPGKGKPEGEPGSGKGKPEGESGPGKGGPPPGKGKPEGDSGPGAGKGKGNDKGPGGPPPGKKDDEHGPGKGKGEGKGESKGEGGPPPGKGGKGK